MKTYLFLKLGKDVVQLKVAELLEDLVLAFDLRHETVEVGVRQLRQVGEVSAVADLLRGRRLHVRSDRLA